MSAILSAGVNSLILRLDTPYDVIRTSDIRDDLIKVLVWCSDSPIPTVPLSSTLVFDGLSLSITIPKLADGSTLVARTPYYVKYAFISSIDPTVYTVSDQLTATPVSPASEIVDISGFTSFIKSDSTTFSPASVTLRAFSSGITFPAYSWTVVGGTPTTGTGQTITITPNSSASTGVTVTLSVTGTGLPVAVSKTIILPIAYVPPTFYISNYGAVFRRDLDGIVYPTSGIVLEGAYSKFALSPAPTFVWKKNNVTISGATSYEYTVPASDYATLSSNRYTCIITGKDLGGNTATLLSSVVIPVVEDGPVGPQNPSFSISNYGAVFRRDSYGEIYPSAGISLETSIASFKSSPAVTYEWKKDGVLISGATANTYTVPVSDYITATTHTYSCIATGQTLLGEPTSLTANVTLPRVDDGLVEPSFTVNSYGAIFRRETTSNVIYPTAGVLLETSVDGFKSSPAVTYQWSKDDVAITGATSATYTVPTTDYAAVSTHKYSCTATGQNTVGEATVLSSSVILTRIDDGSAGPSTPSFTINNYGSIFHKAVDGTIYPTAGVIIETSIAAFKSSPAVTYQWSKDDVVISGATLSTYTVPASDYTSVTTHKYSCTVVGQSTTGVATTLSASTTIPRLDDGVVGEDGAAGPRTATGYIYYNTAQATAPTKPATPTGYNFTTGLFTGLDAAWSSTTDAAPPVAGTKVWAVGYAILEAAYQSTAAPSITISDPFAYQNFTGVVTFTNMNSAFGTNVTTIDGGKIVTGSISAAKLDTNYIQVGSAAGDINTGTTTISGGKITAGTISANKLDTSYIQVGSAASDINSNTTTISGGKITTGSIAADRLAVSFIQVGNAASDINSNTTTISGGKITTGSITADKLTTSFLQVGSAASDINSGVTTISGGKITAGSISADRLATSFLQVGSAANDINTGTTTISGGRITANSISADKLSVSFLQVGGAAADINNNSTQINGGKIVTGSITASSVSASFFYGQRMQSTDGKMVVDFANKFISISV